jgi:hypothetical protein
MLVKPHSVNMCLLVPKLLQGKYRVRHIKGNRAIVNVVIILKWILMNNVEENRLDSGGSG